MTPGLDSKKMRHGMEMGVDGQGGSRDARPRSPLTGALTPNGRPKGVPNKITRNFKAAAEEAFEKGGGVAFLVKMMHGTASDRAAVLGLFGRLIPHQMIGQVDHKVKVELSWLGGRTIGKTSIDMQSPAGGTQCHIDQDVMDVEAIDVDAERLARDP